MEKSKPIRASKTIRGLLLVFLPIVQQLGVELDIMDIIEIGNGINELVLLATQFVGFLIALYSRLAAKTDSGKAVTLTLNKSTS